MKALLNKAADVGFKMAAATSYNSHNPDKLIYPDRKWEVVFPGGSPVFRQEIHRPPALPEVDELAQPDADGKLHLQPTDKVWPALLATVGSWQRDYTKVQAPALALYGTTFFPLNRSDPALAQKLRDFEQNTMVPFRRASMERIQRELRNVKVQQIADRNHMSIGVQQPKPLAATIREFLLAVP
jgi:hypothetical protein